MSGTEDIAAREDAVLWQWPGSWRERFRSRPPMLRAKRGELAVFLLGGLIFVLIILFGSLGNGGDDGLPHSALLGFFGGIAWMFGFFSLYLGYNRVSQVTLTEREIRHAIGFPWPRHETVSRDDVRAVVVYEGDGTVVLLGEAGELLRTRNLAGSAAFAEALGAPTVVWPVRVGIDPHWWTFYLAFWLGVAIIPMFFVAIYPGAYLGIGIVFLLSSIVDVSGSGGGPPLAVIPILITPVLIASMLAMPLSLFLAVAAGRFLFMAETLQGFLHAMADDCPHWHGHSPWPADSRRNRPRLTARYTAWCARIVGAETPPEPLPDLRDAMTPEMARTAIAVAEGAA